MESGSTRAQRAATARAERARRQMLARSLAADYDGVVTRQMMVQAGLTRGQIRTEVDRGAWSVAGSHTLCIDGDAPRGRGRWWRALWESGSRAVLDGVTALLATGLEGWEERAIHVTVGHRAHVRPLPGVVHHHLRNPGEAPHDVVLVGLRRTKPDLATIRAAQWASSDRQAATLIAMTVQQRLVAPATLLHRWNQQSHSPRRQLIDEVIQDVCNGAHSMNELDFARICRRRGLPEPTRQSVRKGRNGRVYLDVYWDDIALHIEVHGAQHLQGTAGIADALRTNNLSIRSKALVSLQVPVLGLRSCPDLFLDQIEEAMQVAHQRLLARGA